MNPKQELSTNTPQPPKYTPMLPATIMGIIEMSQKQIEQVRKYWEMKK